VRCGNQNKMDGTKTHTVTIYLLYWYFQQNQCLNINNMPIDWNFSPVCIYSLFHVLFSLFGRLFYCFRFYCCTRRQKVLLCKSSRKHTICMQWNFGVVSWCECCKHLPVAMTEVFSFVTGNIASCVFLTNIK
jgi:hypothetical protein